jgi:hypothetical protein
LIALAPEKRRPRQIYVDHDSVLVECGVSDRRSVIELSVTRARGFEAFLHFPELPVPNLEFHLVHLKLVQEADEVMVREIASLAPAQRAKLLDELSP